MLDIRGAAPGLLDDPLLLDVSGAPPNADLLWRARLRDDDGFVWRAQAPTAEGLLSAWTPAKASAGPVAALRSLRPVDLDVRVEGPGGDASSRTITRTLLGDGVKVRRWRQDVAGTLYLPPAPGPTALVLDARGGPPAAVPAPDAAPLAAALLASRGVLVFVVAGGTGDAVAAARELVAALPSAPRAVQALAAPLPPGVPDRVDAGDPAAWDVLLADLGARPRRVAR
jgi:hypothetical protein